MSDSYPGFVAIRVLAQNSISKAAQLSAGRILDVAFSPHDV